MSRSPQQLEVEPGDAASGDPAVRGDVGDAADLGGLLDVDPRAVRAFAHPDGRAAGTLPAQRILPVRQGELHVKDGGPLSASDSCHEPTSSGQVDNRCDLASSVATAAESGARTSGAGMSARRIHESAPLCLSLPAPEHGHNIALTRPDTTSRYPAGVLPLTCRYRILRLAWTSPNRHERIRRMGAGAHMVDLNPDGQVGTLIL
jgi:hypothetical protein